MGIISEHNFVFEETGIVAMVLQAVKDLLQGEGDGASLSEATTAAGDAEEEVLDALEIVMELSSGHIALHVTEAVLLGLLGAVGGDVDIAGIFGALDLGAVADVDIDFEDPSVVVSADTNYAALKLSVTDILISNIFDGETGGNTLTGYIDGVIAGGNFQSYSASSKARFDIALSVEYSADAYYTEIKGDEIDAYPLADRYTKLPDGTFVQDNNGTYVREGKSLSDIVDALLEMPALKNALDGALSGQSATLKDLVNMLIASLGIELYIDDPIGDSLDINITGILDLEALKISELLQSFNKNWLDLKDNATKVAILEALDLCIEIVFNPEDGAASAYIALYLIDGYLYIDLSGLGGPKISADLFGLLEKIDFKGNPFYKAPTPDDAEGEAVTAATVEAHECYDDNADGKCDYPGCGKLYASDMVGGVLNALIRAIVLRTNLDAALEGNGNIFEDGLGIDVMLPANMLGAVVALITGAEEDYVFEDFVLNSDESKISLNVGGGNGIELAVSATTDTGFNISVAMNAGIGIDVATADDSVMTSGEMKTYLDMTELVNTVIGLINGGEEGDAPDEFGSQQITLSISGKAEFSSKSEGSYDVGSLLQQYIEDLILEINTENTFEDGIAFRLTVSADLGNIGFGALTNGKLDDDQKLDAFLKETDLTAIEAALELLDRNEAGNITDDVLAGIYLSKGNLYLDGTGVFDIVDNYSYVANFLTFVIEAVNMSKCSCGNFADDDTNGECDNCGGTQPIDCYCGNYADADGNRICDNCGGYDPYCHCEEFVDKDNEGKGNGRCDNCNNLPLDAVSQAYAAVAAARAQALTAAEGDDEVRDAIAEIVYSDTAMQIVITKSVISALLAALMPDLGSLADIFDSFEVSLGAEIGKYDYVDIHDADLYKKEGETYVKITADDPVDGTYYVLTADGEYIEAQPRYDLYETAEYALNENGTGTYVRLASDSSVILDRDRYTFYYQAEGGNYIGITDLAEIGKGEAMVDKDVYVIRGGSYCAIERDGETGKVNTYDRLYGYVRSEHGKLLRVYNPHTDLDEFYLILGAEVGTMNANLAIGGIQLEFGRTDSIIPDYITAGKTKTPEAYDSTVHGDRDAYTYKNGIYTKVAPEEDKEYYYDVPLLPFYDSVITVGASVEFELAITEGEVDVGQIFAGILGDLEGMVIQIPDTSKGYSSAHLRLDLTLVLDMFNLPGSEIEIELYNLSSESGAEVRWLAAYYMNDMIYLDLSFFGLPRLAVPMTEISTLIEDLLSDLLNTSIYDNVEIGTGASEAITADDTANADADEAADMSLEDKVASLLISKRKLSVVLGNGIMRWLLSVITIGDMPLNDLVYEELQGNMNVTIDISDGIDVSLGAELRLEGDRYELYEGIAPESETDDRFYVFTEREGEEKHVEGLFVLDEEEGAFREASDAEINAGELTLYVRHEAVKGADDGWTYYTYTKATEATEGDTYYYYDEAQDAYVAVTDSTSAGKTLYTKSETADSNLPVYRYVSGADANPNDYDTVLDLYVGVNNIDLFFTEEREFTMDRDYLETFHDFNSLDTVSLSETISLELLFSALDIDAIDLTALLEYLFPDSELDFDAVLSAVTGSDSATEILRRLNLTVSLEFKLGAFLNYLRSLAATYDLKYGDKHDVALESLTGDIDLITFINTISALIGAKKVPTADGNIYYEDADVDDLLGLEDFLNFINASVELTTVSNDGVPEHTMLGVYLSLGSNKGEEYYDKNGDENPDYEGQNRYSNYFASEDGNYGYVGVKNDNTDGTKDGYMLTGDIEGYDEEEHGRYSRDTSFLYPDVNGDRVRADAGLYVNLSYFGQPGVYMNLSELMAFISGMMGEKINLDELIPGASEAITAADEDGTADEGGLSLPIDLGELLGGGIDIELPLLTQQISSYIKAFVYGVRITSTYIRILIQTDYLKQLLDILLAPDGSPFDDEFNQSYLGINVDVNNYLYAPLNERADGSDADEFYYYDAEKDDYLLVGSDTPANADRYAGTPASGAELPKYTYIAESAEGGSYKEFVEDKAYFVFIEFAGDTVSAPEEGLFVLDGETGAYRKATEAELNPPETEPVEELTFYARYAAEFVDGVWVYYAYTVAAEGGTHFYDAATDSYVAVSEKPAPENATLYTESANAVGDLLVYGYVEADVNYVIAASDEFYVFTLFSGTSAPVEGLFVLDATGDYRKATAADSEAELYVRHKAQYDGGAWTYYTYDPIDTILGATFEQIDFADTRFTIERDDAEGMYYVYTDTLTGESYLRLRDDMTDAEEAAYNVNELGYWNITPIETYLNVNGNYVLSSEASNTEWVQAERFDSTMAAEIGNAELAGTFVFYVKNDKAVDGHAVLGAVNSGYDLKDVWVVYPSENTKPLIEARVWLWGHSLSLGINMPETAAQDYTYTPATEGGDYVRNEKFIYVPAVIGADTDPGEVYLYYRGEYYEITESALRSADGSAVTWEAFVADPYAYNLRVVVQAESFSANVPVTAADVYARDNYGYTYTYVGEDNGDYVRDESTSLVSVPEFHADFNNSVEYTPGGDGKNYYVDTMGNLVVADGSEPEGTDIYYTEDDFHFVHSTATGRFTSVADARAIFKESGGVDGEFEAWLAANYDTDKAGKVVYYDGEYIKYGDTGELYAINLTIRGSISLGQHMTYYTAEEWKPEFGALPETKYVLVRGEYVEFEAGNLAHEKLTKYYAHADSSSSMNKVLGAILGDMDALFTVSDGYKAVLPFEIRATVKIDYRNKTDYDSLYVAGLELAIDVWRTEATDDTLTHVLGLYYMSDVWNIGDNNDANDIINSAALYADLSWILGPSAKFKIDLSEYPLETILNDKVNLGELFGGGSSEALTAADGEGEGDGNPDVGNPNVATVLLNVFSRKIALQASAGFLKLIVGLIAPNTAATLEEMLPNISIGVDINAAPYDITIGATLFDEEGKGLLDLGITLNLFGTEDKTTGMQIDFGSIEDYDTLSAARFDAVSSEYMFYHALFSRVDEDYIAANADKKTYYTRDPDGGKEYIKVEVEDAADVADLADRAANGERVFVFDDDERYQAFTSAQARDSWNEKERYALIPEGYIRLEDADDYKLATGNDGAMGALQLYVYSHNFTTGADSMVGITSIEAEDIAAGTIGEVGTKQVYVAKPADNRFGDRPASGGYVLDANGAYKKVKGFGSYQTLLGLNINELFDENGKVNTDNLLNVLIDGIADSGLESIEIGGNLSLDLEFKDVLNWTRQMSRLMAVSGSESNYFSMLLSSMAMNSAEFVSKIGLDIDLAVRLEVANLLGMLPSLMGGGKPDIMSLLPAILPGAQIYLEIAIDTNFYGEDIEGAAPIQLWVEVTDDMMLDIYITAPDLGRVTDIAPYKDGTVDSKIGDFFAQGIKIVDLISLDDLLARGASAEDEPLGEATIAAEEEGGGLIIDIEDANVGIVPENIWGILDLLLGQVLFANDMLSVGLTETILAGLIEAMVPEFPKEDLELLPTFKITSGSDTTGVNLLFGDGSLGVQVQLGIQGGFDDFTSIQDAREALGTLIGEEGANVYGIDSYTDYFNDIAYLTTAQDEEGELVYVPVGGADYTGAVQTGGNAVVISTETHALAAYASPEEVWLGDRYELVDFDEDGHPVFGSWDRDEDGNFETDADGARTYAYTLAPVDKGVAYNNAFTLNKNGTGLYGRLPVESKDYQGIVGGQVSDPNNLYIVYEQYAYMLVSNIEKLLRRENEDYKYDADTYDFDEDKVTGEYVLLGDVYVTIELDDLSLALNKPFSAPTASVATEHQPSRPLDEFTAINKLGIRLQTSLDIGFWGETGASVNLGELADLILGIEALKTLLGGTQFVGSDLGITVGGDIGDKENAYYTVNLDAYFKFDGTLQVKLDVIDNHLTTPATILSVILENDTLYADLSGVLGAGVKGKITGLGLKDTLHSALVDAGLAESSAEATTAAIDDTYGMTLHDYAYIAAAINPGYFSLQLTLAAVQAILAKVSADSPDLAVDVELPDLGDIRIESYGDRKDGNLLSLSVKMSEAFGVSMDVKHLFIGTEPIYTEDNPVPKDGYKQLFDVASGELNPDLTISLSANASLAMTSKGLKPGDKGYDDSLAGWAIGLLTNLLGANSFFVSAYDISDTEYNKYGGPIYTKDEAEGTYKLVGTLVKSEDGTFQGYIDAKTGETVTSLDGLGQLYRTTMIEATFAESEVNISIELEADLNLGALISYGIGGILLSDLRLAVKLGSPFTDEGADTTVLEVYYLGSSRLSPEASGSIYTMRKAVNDGSLEAFSDAIYIDASGLGLGKIKFQGIAGLLGANIGQIYDDATAPAVSAAEGDTTEGDTTEDGTTEDGTETAESGSTVSIDLAIDIAENYIGLTVDRSLIEMIFGMIDLGNFTLPQIQNLGLGLTFGENGLSSLALSSTVDPAGTGLHLTLGDFKISLDKSLETDDLVGRVQTQFAGITYSKTAGTMTLISELLEGLNAHLSINIDKQGEMIVQYTGGTSMEICPVVTAPDSKGTVTITGTNQNVTDGPSGVMGTVPNDYLLVLEAVSKHTEAHNDNAVALNLYFGNNSLWLGGVNLGSGDASVVTSLLRILNGWELGSLFDLPGLLGGLTYSDADNNEWSTVNPVATTAAESAEPASEEGRASTAADVIPNIPKPNDKDAWTNKTYSGNQASHYKVENGASTYSYDLKLEGLVNKVSVNLFTKEGYQPYLSSMTDGSLTSGRESSLISVNIELTKQGYNELMIFVYTMLLSLIHVKSDLNANWGRYFVYDGEKFEDPSLTVGWAIYGTPLTRHAGEEGYDSRYSGHYYKYVISNLFRELDSIQGDSEAATQARVDLLTPYVKSLPISLLNWIVHDMANMNRDTVRALMSIVASSLGNITCLLATALPPFADMEDDSVPNPSLNLYIDLAPQTTFYGFKDGREIVPGIQSIELMVNAEKYGYGKNLQQGSVTGEICEGGSSTGNFDNAYVLSINPLNLVTADVDNNNDGTPDSVSEYSGQGLLSFLEADRLSSGSILTTTSGVPVNDLHIVVTDVASKEATMYRTTTGEAVGSDGTLNAKFLTDRLPTTTRVEVVDPAVSNHDVTVVWDAGAIDYTPAITHIFEDEDEDGLCDGCGKAEFPVHTRLAGFVYGYAMNLVVAKIPVYIVPDQQFVSVAPANGGKLELKMDGTGNFSLPDLVRIKFSSGRSSVFGTARINAEGGIAYALRKSGSNFQFKVTNASGAISYGYYPITTQSTDTVTYELALYPAYNAYTSEDNTVKVAGVEYYVLEGVGIMPVGSFSWDLSYFDYGWDGASRYAADGDYTAKVGITYQWGYSAEQTHEISVPVTAAKIDSKISRYAYTGDVNWQLGNEFNSWNQLKEVMGITSGDTLASDVQNWFARITGIAGGKYLKPGDTSRATGSGIASKSVVGWDVSALVYALNARVGEELEVQVTMFVEGFTIWRQYEQDAAGNLSLIHGMMDDVGIEIEHKDGTSTWVIAYEKAHHEQIVKEMGGLSGTVEVAQPVTVTVTIGAEPDFAWKTDDTEAASANSYRFSDGTVIDTDGGVQRYEITTAAQLYGSMPESGVVVDGATGRTKAARFDWNGFVYDTDLDYDVARLSVETGGVRSL